MSKNKKNKRDIFQKFTLFFSIIAVIGIVVWSGVYAVNYAMGENTKKDEKGNEIEINTPKKKIINALVCGINEDLTDTILYIKYNVETGKIAMMSIPRDTSIVSNPAIDSTLKINYIYYRKGAMSLIKEVENLLDVDIDYYLIFDANMLKEMVDAIGGIEVDVPIRMKYDDPTQDLHIDLQPGVQVLNGAQAEGFVRFRHNNDMTVGYPMGDIQRTEVQQGFIKTFISAVMSPKNIGKIPQLINIALKNTDTNVTAREGSKYITDASKLDIQNIFSCTAPGGLKDVGQKPYNWMSFYILDKAKVKETIKENFPSDVSEQQ